MVRIACKVRVWISATGPLAEEGGGGLLSGCSKSMDLDVTTAQAPRREERKVLLPSPAALDWEAWEVSRGELGPDHMLGDRCGQADRHSSGLVLGDAHKLI